MSDDSSEPYQLKLLNTKCDIRDKSITK